MDLTALVDSMDNYSDPVTIQTGQEGKFMAYKLLADEDTRVRSLFARGKFIDELTIEEAKALGVFEKAVKAANYPNFIV